MKKQTSNKSSRNTKTATKRRAPSTITANRLLQSVRQQRHRAALLGAASDWLIASFSTAMGNPAPELFVQEANGTVEPADPEVVLDVTMDLRMQAEALRQALLQLRDKKLTAIKLGELPVLEDTEPNDEAVPSVTGRQESAAAE